jgi:hypothetical protein
MKEKNKMDKMSTIRPSKLSNSIDETFMEFDCPSKPWFWIGGEDKA